MQACSWEAPFHSTKLFNKVDIGRIFCKAKEANRERQADKFKNTGIALRIYADQGMTI